MSDEESLFRPEVIEARKRRIYGDVVIRQSWPGWIFGSILGGILLLGLLVLIFSTYSRTERVRGLLVPAGGTARILAPRTGVIAEVYVREGQQVAAGAPLVLIRINQALPGGATVQEQQREILEQQHGIADDQIEHALRDLRRQEASVAARLASLRTALDSTREQLAIGTDIIRSAQNEFESLNSLAARRLVRQAELEARRRTYLGAQSQQRGLRAEFARLTNEIEQAGIERSTLADRTRDAVRRLEASRNETELRLLDLRGRSTILLTAPIAGTVAGLQANVGMVATPDRPVLTVLPFRHGLQAYLFVPTDSAGFLRVGQPVRLRYDAFPYQQFGTFAGTITEVSRNTLAPGEIAVPIQFDEPVYRVVVRLDGQAITAYGQRVPLTPGLTLTSSIVLERRSLFDVLLEPVRAVRARS